MRYSLCTLLFLMAVGPPLLAAIYLDRAVLLGVLGGIVLCAPVCVLVAVIEAIGAWRRRRKRSESHTA